SMDRLLFLTPLLGLVLAAQSSWAQPGEKPERPPLSAEERKTELARLREVLASVDELPAKDARWVEVQAGPANDKRWEAGWLLRETEDTLELLGENGSRHHFDRKKARIKKGEDDFAWYDAWAVRDADFPKFCQAYLSAKPAPEKEDPNEIGVYRFQR